MLNVDEKREKLLTERGVLVLPSVIEHETYEMMLEALLIMAGRDVRLFCRGNGGDSDSALAIVDLIREHGKVIGLLAGGASSSHAVIWASCSERFIYPLASIGIHKVAWESIETRVDADNAQLLAAKYDRYDRANAEILAAASNESVFWWSEMFRQAGSGGLKVFDSVILDALHMARPIAEYHVANEAARLDLKKLVELG